MTATARTKKQKQTKRAKSKPRARPRAIATTNDADPFAGLWSFDGSLAEVTRAKGVRMTPAVYAAASMDTTLIVGEEGGHVRVEAGARVYSTSRGEDVATMQLSGDTLIVQFLAPQESAELVAAKRFYKPVRGKPGWLEFRRPATKSLEPELTADLGSIIGQACFERRSKKKHG